MRFADIDGCPVPVELEQFVRAIKAAVPGASLNSCYRGDDPAGVAILRKHGKHNQRYLYQHQNEPGFHPANPPGQSTHECRSDGVVYRVRKGAELDGWQCGMDWEHMDDVMREARELGYALLRPYHSGNEAHHGNLMQPPKFPFPVLREGSGPGPRVYRSIMRLHRLGYLTFPLGYSHWRWKDHKVTDAVKAFQRKHHLHVDGVIGPVTYANLRAADRAKTARKKTPPLNLTAVVAPSGKAAEFIAGFEGGQNPRDHLFHPYKDPVGVWTIGYGHTEGVTAKSKPLNQAQAEEILLRDLRSKYGPAVQRAAGKAGVKLNQNQFDALTSFVYNLGTGILGADHTIGQSLRRKDLEQVADDMLLYDKAGSPPKALAGLTRRRKAERTLFLRGTS